MHITVTFYKKYSFLAKLSACFNKFPLYYSVKSNLTKSRHNSVVLLFTFTSIVIAGCSKDEAEPKPSADFIISTPNPVIGEQVYFTSSSQNGVTYKWTSASASFSSAQQNPRFIFSKAGTYQITLEVSGQGGKTTVNKTLQVTQPADAGGIAAVDQAMIEFMNKYSVPGMAVAITKEGKLIYKKGYGDANMLTHEKATPDHLFRIASVSKTITSVAIMKLIQEGKLSMDDRVFGPLGILGTQYGTLPYKTDIENIKVRHLLQHTGGGWGNSANDPMFIFSVIDYNPGQLISYVLDNIPLKNKPGMVYEYSNFGYCILARIIEKITGKTYEEYVKESVFTPIGVNNAFIAGNTLQEKKNTEVIYYNQDADINISPYSKQVSASRLDASAGWIISPKDMAKFLVSVDGFATKPDILGLPALSLMTETSAANSYYASGWQVNQNNDWWHSGSLVGTATLAVRANNGFCWVVFANTRSLKSTFTIDMDKMMWNLNQQSISWPTEDLF
ncbi:MAG: serine hydrolase [Daejeonella sp.]